MFKRLIVAALCCFLIGGSTDARLLHGSVASAPSQGVFTLKTGAGGQITSVDIQCDQGVGACNNSGTTTKVIRTDTGGVYVQNPSAANPGNAGGTGVWVQLITTASIPYANQNQIEPAETTNNMGGFEFRIAPSNTNVGYLVYNGYVLVTTNLRATTPTFCDTGLTQQSLNTNQNTKFESPFLAVDPANPDNVIFGTLSNGIYFTTAGRTCGGASWTAISTSQIPAAGSGNGYIVAFDPTTSSGGSTPGVYVSSYGNGVYHHTSGALSTGWSHMSGSPTTQLHIVVGSDGFVWFIDNSAGNFNGSLWTMTAGTWSLNSVTTGQGLRGVAIDPNNVARAVIIDAGGGINVTTNHGGSFVGYFGLANGSGPLSAPQLISGSVSIATGSQSLTTAVSGIGASGSVLVFSRANPNKYIRGTVTSNSGTSLVVNITSTSGSGSFTDGLVNWGNPVRIATDVPWLMGTNENFMTAGDIIFDAAQSNVVFFAEGIGVWTFSPPNTVGPYVYNSLNSGIEQLVGMGVASPWNAGSTPVTASWDRPFFNNPNNGTYPLSHGVTYTNAIALGMGVDWAASQNPAFIAGQTASLQSGTSADNGTTWSLFGSEPASIETNGQASGTMAVADTTHMIWEESFNGDPYYTTNGGSSWVKICVTGIPCGATSTTTHTITGSGNVTFTTSGASDCTFLNFSGVSVTVYETAGNTSGMSGTISSCTSGNQFTIAVTSSFGSGSFSAWKIRPTTGWGTGPGNNYQQFAADRVNATTFYAYNSSTGNVYVSTTATPLFSVAATNPFSSASFGFVYRMKCVPGQAGNCFWTSGPAFGSSFPQSGFGLYRTTNSAVTWNSVGPSNGDYTIQEIFDFGFGNACGNAYPTIFLYGWVGRASTFTNGSASISAPNNFAAGQQVTFLTTGGLPTNFAGGTTYVVSATGLSPTAFQVALTPTGTPIVAGSAGSGTQTVMAGGVWRSKDNAATWQQQTGLYPDGIIDQVTAIEGDANICGRFYYAKQGTGFSYGQFNFLLKKDIDPSANDNDPMWLEKAA